MHAADDALIHAPLVDWASRHPRRPALVLDAHAPQAQSLDYASLQAQIAHTSARLRACAAPAICLTGGQRSRPCQPDDATETRRAEIGQHEATQAFATVPGCENEDEHDDRQGREKLHEPRQHAAEESPLSLLTDFLGIIATGRCAAVADPDWPDDTRARVATRLPQHPHDETPPSPETPFYIGFTSGSTGLPKGFRRSHRSWVESFRVTLRDFGPDAAGPILAPGRLSHSLFLFGALLGLWNGQSVFLQSRFSAAGTLHTLRHHAIPVLVAVPSQLHMLIASARHQGLAPITGPRLILISGARWPHDDTPALQALFPAARILCFYGASETSYISWMPARRGTPASAVGSPFSNVQLHIGPSPRHPPLPAGQPGLIWVKSPMLFRDYINVDDHTAAIRIDDWISVRDIGHLDENGILHLDGRENRMIVSKARNIFPEEIESCLARHPAIAHASVHGIPDPVRGHCVHAVLCLKAAVSEAAVPRTAPHTRTQPAPPASTTHPPRLPESQAVGAADLIAWCQQTLEAWKTPRRWWIWQGEWPQTGSAKTEHGRIAQALNAHLRCHSDGQPSRNAGMHAGRQEERPIVDPDSAAPNASHTRRKEGWHTVDPDSAMPGASLSPERSPEQSQERSLNLPPDLPHENGAATRDVPAPNAPAPHRAASGPLRPLT